MADEIESGEATTAEEIAAARQAFLSEPPAILATDEPVVVDDAALEAAALDEAIIPPVAPEAAATPAAPAAPAPAATGTDPFAEFGGEQAVRDALAVQASLRTEQGLRVLVANGLDVLGYDPVQIKAALDAAAAGEPAPNAAPDPLAGLEDDDMVDVKTLRGLLQATAEQAAAAAVAQTTAATQPALQTIEQQLLEQQQATVRTNTDAALISVLGPPPADPAERQQYIARVDAIVAAAASKYDPSQVNNPAHFHSIVADAKAQVDAAQEVQYQAYLAEKKRARDTQPVNTGGGAGGDGPLPEPKSLAEAREQARAAGFFD